MEFDKADLLLEVTRWCNLECAHCLRGDRRRRRMKRQTIETVFRQNRDGCFGILQFSGGEPTLAVDLWEWALDCARMYHVVCHQFALVTNGTRPTRRVFRAIRNWLLYCDDNEISNIRISLDQYHLSQTKIDRDAWQMEYDIELHPAFPDLHLEFDVRPFVSGQIIDQGRAKGWGAGEPSSNLSVDEQGFVDGTLYVNALGQVLRSCDLSYDEQSEAVLFTVDENWTLGLERYFETKARKTAREENYEQFLRPQ